MIKQSFFISIILAVTIFLSCSDKNPPTSNSGGGNNGDTGSNTFYRIEEEPLITANRLKIAMIRNDTVDVSLNGIYQANVSNPVRNLVYLEENLHSPTITSNGNKAAYLKNSRLYYYFTTGDSTSQSKFDKLFNKVVYINDTLLIGSSQNYLYIINEKLPALITIVEGVHPTVYKQDTLSFIQNIGNSQYAVIKFDIKNLILIPGDAVPLDTIDIFVSNQTPQSFAIEPRLDRYCYSVLENGKYSVYTKESGIDNINLVATSSKPGVAMINFNKVVFQGTDGRLFRTEFDKNDPYPFWGWAGPE